MNKKFEFNEEKFRQQRQTINKKIAIKFGTKLINLVSRENLCEDDLQLVYDLLIIGANPNMQDSFGNTGLMHMINKKLEVGAKMYLASGCDVNTANYTGDTALSIAKANNNQDVANLIEEFNGAERSQTPNPTTPFGSDKTKVKRMY